VALLLIFLLRLWSTVAASAPKRECTVQRSSSKKRFGHFAGTKKNGTNKQKMEGKVSLPSFQGDQIGANFRLLGNCLLF
jgi:hypothetical protein